jgi:hypothetical protein
MFALIVVQLLNVYAADHEAAKVLEYLVTKPMKPAQVILI